MYNLNPRIIDIPSTWLRCSVFY